jgi:hypothetical protein
MFKNFSSNKSRSFIAVSVSLFLLLAVDQGFAITLAGVKETLVASMGSLAKSLLNVCLASGVGFILVSFYKFHAHRSNPQQVQLSLGIVYMILGAGYSYEHGTYKKKPK